MLSPLAQRRATLLLIGAGLYGFGWWHHHLLHPGVPVPQAAPNTFQAGARPRLPAPAAEAFAGLPEKLPRGQQLPDIASKAERDPGAAFRALMADPLLQTADNARALFLVLGKNDPAEGFTLLSQIPAVPWKRDAIRGLATGWTQRDPSAAAAAGLALPSGVPRADFLAATFAQWILQDLTAATKWVSSLPRNHAARSFPNWKLSKSKSGTQRKWPLFWPWLRIFHRTPCSPILSTAGRKALRMPPWNGF
ncbi:MAG: hypothetical protein V4675_22220 [Verrucomicrobiota bacterium]